jgi:hypothetical protein
MTSILKVDTIQDQAGNNIINESSDTITIGASGDTVNIVGTLQNNGSAVGGGTQAFDAGTVSLPSITTTGDTNTGMFFPAADEIAFAGGGTERMRIKSNGNLQNSLDVSNTLFRQVSRGAGNATETFTAGNMGFTDNSTALINISVGGQASTNEYGGALIYWYMPYGFNSVIQTTIVSAFKGAGISSFSVAASGNSLVVTKDSDVGVFITIIGGGGIAIL